MGHIVLTSVTWGHLWSPPTRWAMISENSSLIVLETFLMILTFFSTFTDGTSLLASFVCYDIYMILFCVHNSYQIKTGNLVKGLTIFGIKQLLKYCFIQHPFVLTLMRKHCFPVGTINCVEFACSPQVCMGFLRGFWFPPIPQRCAYEVNRCVYTVPVWVSISVSGPVTEQHPVQGCFTSFSLSCRDRLWPWVTLNWNKHVGNSFLLVFIHLS